MPNLFRPELPATASTSHVWTGLQGSSLSLAIANAATHSNSLLVVVTADMAAANRLEREIRFFAPQLVVHQLPDWETLPYDQFSPHPDIISQRLLTLYRLASLECGILIVPIPTLMHRLLPCSYVAKHSLALQVGDKLVLQTMRQQLEKNGYYCVSQVMGHGEFAVRGSILDLFPMGSQQPYRIELFDEEIETIRTFDPDTQRSADTITSIQLLPAREYPLTEEAITRFRQQWREYFPGNPAHSPLYQSISQGSSAPGIEYYLPLFFEQTQTLFDYLPATSTLIRIGELNTAAEAFEREVKQRYEQYRYDTQRPILPPKQLFLAVDELFTQFKQFPQIKYTTDTHHLPSYAMDYETVDPAELFINSRLEQPLAAVKDYLSQYPGRVLFCAETAGRREAITDLLRKQAIVPHFYLSWSEFLAGKERLGILIGPLEQGLSLTEPAISIIAETQLFGQQILQQRRRKTRSSEGDAMVRNLAELSVGAAVVHIDHGVGRYQGLQLLEAGGIQAEYLTLAYADGAKLYVPVSSLHLISRYSGVDPEQAPLHRLGTDQWQKAKRKATEQIHDVAAELLDLQARRQARVGHAFDYPLAEYAAFAAAFPFEETPDQQQAIEAVIADMTSGKPMDRLVCGDVGFGKTEVAMRAAFIAVQAGKQVAILVPTTLLAQQHYQNFKDRFADWPVHIDVISRFRSRQEQGAVLEQLKEGKLDILIGTHKLLQEDIKFTRLGLVIIDEEHRFGVRQKERLKALRAEVDILTLTATPIPRTLNMAFAGMRDLSIIATPPARRLSVKTFARERNANLIKEAIQRELLRGGQVYFLHNAVDTITRVAEEIAVWVPEARIAIAHGQLHERDLERIMVDFYHQRYNVLVCTTIIETGIDIPSANTIIIDRADRFGLAQLHQLRGRVGRSHHQAYAYLLTPPVTAITKDAVKRLDAIASLEELGAGFTLATHDLEIRGAGELLGEEQSGNMQALGFSLYMELLERAVHAIKTGQQLGFDDPNPAGAEINLQIPALLPADYLPDVHTRLILYKRIASADSQELLNELQVELIDRFGLLPEATKNLFDLAALKLLAKPLGIRKIDANEKGGRLEFEAKTQIEPLKLIQLLQKYPQNYRLEGTERLRFSWEALTAQERIKAMTQLLHTLQ